MDPHIFTKALNDQFQTSSTKTITKCVWHNAVQSLGASGLTSPVIFRNHALTLHLIWIRWFHWLCFRRNYLGVQVIGTTELEDRLIFIFCSCFLWAYLSFCFFYAFHFRAAFLLIFPHSLPAVIFSLTRKRRCPR